MSVFSAAIDAIFTDANMAADALWFPGVAVTGTPVRVIRRAEDAVSDFGSSRLRSETTRVDIRVSDAATIAANDRVEIDGDTFVVQSKPLRDRERLVWSVDLRPQT